MGLLDKKKERTYLDILETISKEQPAWQPRFQEDTLRILIEEQKKGTVNAMSKNQLATFIDGMILNKIDAPMRGALDKLLGLAVQSPEEFTILIAGLTLNGFAHGGKAQYEVMQETYLEYPTLIVYRLMELVSITR